MRTALITGLAGETLTADERAFLKSAAPSGVILFTRNCRDHGQIRSLVGQAREAVGADDFLVLIDQEGGRVQRLRPPLGRALPRAGSYARLYEREPARALDAAFLVARLVAADLAALGITMNCAPVLDIPSPGSHAIIGDRAYGATPDQVAALGRAVAEGLLAGGLAPVLKHIPGHGRAMADSHLDLPVVDAPHAELSATDFAPFKALSAMPAAMTAHVVFSSIDASAPASTSARVTAEVIRGEIGFDGLLMSDDLAMKALQGAMRGRAEAVIAAGSDVALHCNGDLSEMEAAAAGAGPLSGRSLERFRAAVQAVGRSDPFEISAAEGYLASVLALEPIASESV